ncbi:metallopeptidase family protein [Roseovarius sp. D22-M7]|uniref:metallopeptidase family protein n=1 Tax=Roseovarius sp. D22-M7 TaxID=3127116 RepID=UPI00300FB02A
MTDDWTPRLAPGLEDIAAMARAARAALPEAYRPAATEVSLRVEDFAPDSILQEMSIHDAFGLTGLYDGIPLTEKSVMDQPHGPDTIWLFRRPILDEWADRGNVALGALVAHVYVHELAHHFGWSDAEIAAIDPWWE